MKKLLFVSLLLLFSIASFAQEYEVKYTQLVFEIPNESWTMTTDKERNGLHLLTFKREAIDEKNGSKTIPNISFISEDVGELEDVII